MKKKLKKSKPLVSIIVTCYNNSETLCDAISSIFSQCYQNWEIIFVDDGSSDKSLEIVNKIFDYRIKIFSLGKNFGRGVSYQKGLYEANGEFIMFLDSDDWWYSRKISKQIEYLENNKSIMVVGSGLITANNYNPLGVRCNKEISNKINKNNISDPPLAFATICMRKEIISKYVFDKKLKVAQDIDFLRIVCMNEPYSNIKDILYVYNESRSFNYQKIRIAWKNTKIGLKKHKNNFLIKYYISLVKINFKIFIYSILFFCKLEKLILKLRISKICKKDLRTFYKEKNLMLNMKLNLFNK